MIKQWLAAAALVATPPPAATPESAVAPYSGPAWIAADSSGMMAVNLRRKIDLKTGEVSGHGPCMPGCAQGDPLATVAFTLPTTDLAWFRAQASAVAKAGLYLPLCYRKMEQRRGRWQRRQSFHLPTLPPDPWTHGIAIAGVGDFNQSSFDYHMESGADFYKCLRPEVLVLWERLEALRPPR